MRAQERCRAGRHALRSPQGGGLSCSLSMMRVADTIVILRSSLVLGRAPPLTRGGLEHTLWRPPDPESRVPRPRPHCFALCDLCVWACMYSRLGASVALLV